MSLYDISWQVTEEEYRADPAYSYSTLAKFDREGFDNLETLFDRVESPSLLFGSMVDTMLTDGIEEFNKRFAVFDYPELSDSLTAIAKDLFNNYADKYSKIVDIPDDILAEIGLRNNYYAGDKYRSYRVKKIKEECSNYYNLLYAADGKIPASTQDYLDTVSCVEVLKSDEYTKWYFQENDAFNDDIQRFYQLKFKTEWDGIPLRCMADLIIVDNKNKIIIPCDLKTSYKKEWNFFKSFIEWRYWIQAQLYWYIIRKNLDASIEFRDYTLAPYRFIVINRITKKPLVWIYDDTMSETDCVYHSETENKDYRCRNWRNIVKELDTYLREKPTYPIGIKSLNNICEWLRK